MINKGRFINYLTIIKIIVLRNLNELQENTKKELNGIRKVINYKIKNVTDRKIEI
jgi:hypothetical protein